MAVTVKERFYHNRDDLRHASAAVIEALIAKGVQCEIDGR
jgi:hypothetical protein